MPCDAELVAELNARMRLGERLILLSYANNTRHIVACHLGYTGSVPDYSPRWQFVADVSGMRTSLPYMTRSTLEADNKLGAMLSAHPHRVVVWRWLSESSNQGQWELEPEE